MAHMMIKGKDFMASGSGVLPWHHKEGMSETVAGLMTAEQVLAKARLNWEVRKVPLYFDPSQMCYAQAVQALHAAESAKDSAALAVAKERLDLLKRDTLNGHFRRSPDAFGIVRSDTGDFLGSVGARYTPIQNAQGLDVLDPVIGDAAAYETGGSIHGGKTVYLTAKTSADWAICEGDTFKTYLLVYMSHDGKHPVTIRFVQTRVVCWNTLSAAIGECPALVSVRHTRNAPDKLAEAHRILKLADKHQQAFRKALGKLAAEPMSERQGRNFLGKLFPDESDEESETKREKRSDRVFELFRSGTGNEGKTRYDMLNGVTEFVDHKREQRIHGGKDSGEARFESTQLTTGATLKSRAFELLTVDLLN